MRIQGCIHFIGIKNVRKEKETEREIAIEIDTHFNAR